MKDKVLFSPIKIGNLIVKNRIVMSPMVVSLANQNGEVTRELIEYYEARAKGGAGLIIVEAACVDTPAGREAFGQLNIDNASYISGLARLADSIKAYSTRAFIQLFHAGRQTSRSQTGGIQPVAPSPIPCKITKEIPRELSIAEIKEIENKFIIAAYYAFLAGFEGVEIHAAHGYLINQFLSPNSNQRNDEYGGVLSNRMRILLNIVKGIKNLVPSLAISVRLNIDDFVENGLTPSEAILIAKALENEGVDLLNCSAGIYESGLNSIEPSSYQEGWRVYLAKQVKSEVKIPVMTGGVIRSPELANEIVEKGHADLVFIGRSLIADANWANKARLDQVENIRPCIMCNNCIKSNFEGKSVTCTVNPSIGREGEVLNYSPTFSKYKIAVVGGGPAGLKGAISLAKLGFKVSLYEKASDLGGQLHLACLPPYKDRIKLYLNYLKKEVYKQDISLHLNYEFTPADLRQGYDMVVIATGSKLKEPAFLIKNSNIINLAAVLTEEISMQNSEVVIVGGGRNGCELADFLLNRNNSSTIIEQANYLAEDMEKKNRRDLMNRLATSKVRKLTNCKVSEIINNEVKFITNDKEDSIKADYFILTTGYDCENKLYEDIVNIADNVHLIGDAFAVKGIRDAVFQGHMIAKLAYYQYKRGI